MTATLDGSPVMSSLMLDADWVRLRETYRTRDLRMTCGGPAVPKTSPRGLRFFAHHPGQDCGLHLGGPETAEHHAAKLTLAAAARAAGWEAEVEAISPDRAWIADVLISRGVRKIALEVQWSPQAAAVFAQRTARYRDAGVGCVWFLGPANHAREVAGAYLLNGDADSLRIDVPGELGKREVRPTLEEGVARLFRREFQAAAEVRVSEVTVTFFKMKCFRTDCDSWYSRWFITGAEGVSRCGQQVSIDLAGTRHGRFVTRAGVEVESAGHDDGGGGVWGAPWGSFAQTRGEERLQDALRPALEPHMPPPCRYGRRSSAQVPEGYVAALCPRCGTMQGDAHLLTGSRRPYQVTVPWAGLTAVNERHWCRDVGNRQCALAPSHQTPFPLLHQDVEVTAIV